VDAADENEVDARGVEVGQDRQGLAVLRGLGRDLDPAPGVGEEDVAPGVDVRDRRPAVADVRCGVVLAFQSGLLSAVAARTLGPGLGEVKGQARESEGRGRMVVTTPHD
jgi:hypothetical protein